MIPVLPGELEKTIPLLVRQSWMLHEVDVRRSRYYYYGDVFTQVLDKDVGTLQYPVGINLVKALLEKIAFFFWGQRNIGTPKHQVFGWQIEGVEESIAGEMLQVLRDAYRRSRGDRLFHQILLDAMLDGLSWIRPKSTPDGMVLSEVLWDQGKPVYSPFDVSALDGVVYHYPVDGDPGNEFIQVFRPRSIATAFGETVEETPNLYGEVPFVPFVLFRGGARFMGETFTASLMGIQNELNARIADTGDAINNDAHPKYAVANSTTKVKDLPTGVDAIWDLGMGSMNQEPKAWVLQGRSVGESGISLSNLLKDFLDVVSHIPDVAMGRVAGSQRSGHALSTRLEVIVNAIETWRAFMVSSLVEMSAMILRMNRVRADSYEEPCGYTSGDVKNADIRISMNPILRKDEREILDWNIAAVQGYLKHPVDAMRDIGERDPEGTYQRVLQHMKEIQKMGIATQQIHTTKTVKQER